MKKRRIASARNMSKEDKRRLQLNKRLDEKTIEEKRAKFARPTDSKLFVKTNGYEAVRAPLNKRLIAIILAIVMVVGLIPAGVFMLRPKAEGFNNLEPVEMELRVNGRNQGTVQMEPGPIDDHIGSVAIENPPAKLQFEGAFLIDRSTTPATETKIASVGKYGDDVYYSLYDENDTGIKKTSHQQLVLVYSSEYTVTTNPGEGGSIDVDETVPYGTDLNVTVTAPKGNSISSVTYQIGDSSYTATVNNNGNFTIPGSQVVNDIVISSTYAQIATYAVRDARKVQNSKYYNLYGLEGHGGITATIGVSAKGQPYDDPVIGSHKVYDDWNADKYLLFTRDAVLCNQQWEGRTYSGAAVYGAPGTRVYADYNNISTASNGTISDIRPNSVANGASTSFYLYSQSRSGDSNGWSLNLLSINGEEIVYPVGTTTGAASAKTTTMKDGTNVTVTLVSTDSPLYWNNGDVSYSTPTIANANAAYFAKTSTSSADRLWSYGNPTVNKHRYIYKVDIDHVQDNLDVAYNFKDVDSRKIIITGREGIEETGAAYEWRGHGVSSTGSTSALVRMFESRDYYYTSASNPATSDATDLNDWKQHEYDAFYFERYGNGATFVPSANVYTYRVKPGYNPYTVTAKARYIDGNGNVTWLEGADLLAGPVDGVIGDLDTVILRASEESNAKAKAIVQNANIPESWKDDDSALVNWITNYLSFNSNYRFWGTSDNLTHGNVSERELRRPIYSSSTHNTPDSSRTSNKLFLNRIADYENVLKNEDVKNYKFYGLALQQNEAKDQLLQLNAHPYQYTMVFDANGGSFTNLEDGYARLNGEFSDSSIYTNKTAESIKFNKVYTLENGSVTTYMPKRSMQPERKGYYFAGWKLYQNNAVVENDDYDEYYFSNAPFDIDENTVDLTEGNVKADQNHTFTFKAEWVPVAPESDMVNVSVSVYKQTGNNAETKEISYEPVVVEGETIENKIERQIAGDTVLLNQYKPEPETYYVLDEARSVLETETSKNSDETNDNNQLKAYFKWRSADLTVAKRVNGNPKALKDGFEITVLLTKNPDSPVTAAQAAAMIVESNPDNISLSDVQVEGDTVKFVGTFGRSTKLVLQDVPYGWTATVSEPKAAAPEAGQVADYETEILTNPENLGSVNTVGDKTTWSGTITEDTTVTVNNKSDSYLVLDKNIDRNNKGSYDLTLEAYATGDVTSEKVTEKIPTDFILVVDQSGSMAIKDMAKRNSYTDVGQIDLETAATGNYYIEVDGETYPVYGKRSYLYNYYPANTKYVGNILDDIGASLSWFQGNQEQTVAADNQYVVYRDGKYIPLHISIQGKLGTYYIFFHYFDHGTRVEFDRENESEMPSGEKAPSYKNVFTNEKMSSGGLYEAADLAVQTLYPNDKAYTYSEIEFWFIRTIKITTGMYINYDMFKKHIGYTGLYYRDSHGIEHAIQTIDEKEKTEYCNANGEATVDKNGTTRMYYNNLKTVSSEGMTTRLEALQDALYQFTDAVASQSDDLHDKVDNRIAIVGFAGDDNSNNNEVLTNTGLAINADSEHGISAYPYTNMSTGPSADNTNGYYYFPDGKNYNGPTNDYANALLKTTDDTQLGQIKDAIRAVTAYGGTQPEYGLEKAKSIFDEREETTYSSVAGSRERNKVVVFFTDGEPGDYDYSHRLNEANDVIEKAKILKDDNVTVFSVGVFGESDAEPLTYSKYAETSDTSVSAKAHEYELGFWKKVYGGSPARYRYLNRYWMSQDVENYGANENDTIFDYMSAVSSNYPAATGFWDENWTPSSNKTWLQMTQEVRDPFKNSTNEEDQDKKALSENKYYRMAASQEALIAAFLDIAQTESEDVSVATTGMDGTTALLRDVINSEDFVIPENPERDLVVKVYTQKGDQLNAPTGDASEGIDFHNNEWVDITNDATISWYKDEQGNYKDENGNAYVDVSGFDYGANFIANGKSPNAKEDTAQHEGKKLIVTISGLEPKQKATGKLESNTGDSGIYKLVVDENDGETKALQMDAFTSPHIYRYQYNLTEPSVKTDDKFNITFNRTDADASKATSIMALYDENGNREAKFFDENNNVLWEEAKNGDAIYFELLEKEKDNQLKATVPNVSEELQKQYTYSLALIDSDADSPKEKTFGTQFSLKTENSTIQVTNVSNKRDVTITEETRGVAGQADYSDKDHQFPIQMTLMDGATPVNEEIEATITRKKTGETETVTLRFGNDGKLNTDVKLANGDKIEFQVLNGYTLTVFEKDSDAGAYDVSYEPTDETPENGTDITISDTNYVKVINTLHENPDIASGISDGKNPFIAILAGLAVISGGAGAAYVYRKKDEFVKR